MSQNVYYNIRLRRTLIHMGTVFDRGFKIIYEGKNDVGYKWTHENGDVTYVPFEDADLVRNIVVCIDHEEVVSPDDLKLDYIIA